MGLAPESPRQLINFFFCFVRQERVKLITLIQLNKLAACEDDRTFYPGLARNLNSDLAQIWPVNF